VVQEGFVDGDQIGGIREGGESGSLPGGHELFRCPDVMRRGLG